MEAITSLLYNRVISWMHQGILRWEHFKYEYAGLSLFYDGGNQILLFPKQSTDRLWIQILLPMQLAPPLMAP